MDLPHLFLLLVVALFIGGIILRRHRLEEAKRQEEEKRRLERQAAFEALWEKRFFLNADDPRRQAIALWFLESDYLDCTWFDHLLQGWEKGAALVSDYEDLVEAKLESLASPETLFIEALLEKKAAPVEKDRLAFNRRWCEKEILRAATLLTGSDGRQPNRSQATAAVDNDDRTLVLAGAGTGKTATIVAKTRYLLKSGRARADEILLLAYNHDAAEEMRERIGRELGESIHIRTFHSFGNALLKENEAEKRAVSNLLQQPKLFDSFVVDRVRELANRDADYAEALLTYFVDHAAPLEVESQFESPLDRTLFVRSHDLTTFAGERVKSGGELLIANLLYYWQVPYAYEARYPVKAFAYKPDFLVSDRPFTGTGGQWKNNYSTLAEGAKSAWIEYFGIDAEGHTAPWIDEERYRIERERKISLHREEGTTLIELTTADLMRNELKEKLLRALTEARIPIRPLGTATFCLRLWDDDSTLNPRWRHFLDLVRTFLPLLKDSGKTLDEIRKEAYVRAIDTDRFDAFRRIFEPILTAYDAHLEKENARDFGDMIAAARATLAAGKKLPYKYVLVDEFQDISRSRALLLQAILAAGPGTKLFAVGDDWQSIYRFSGSDTRYVSHFSEFFGTSTVLELDTGYRYPEELHHLTADFVTRNPEQLKKRLRADRTAGYPCALMRDVRSLLTFSETLSDDELRLARNRTPQSEAYKKAIEGYLAQFAKKAAERGGKMNRVMILGRRRWENMPALADCPTVAALSKAYPSLEIVYRTVHSAKGLEADYVIIVGNEAEIFPSEREGDQIIEAVLPTAEAYPFAEERRLFYVAMTRAKHFLLFLYDGERESLFMSELRETAPLDQLRESGREAHFRCPHCGLGLISKQLSQDGRPYFACTNTATCGRFFAVCPDCGSPVADDESGRYCLNLDCDNVRLHCPQCGYGTLKKRRNKTSGRAFMGCSFYKSPTGMSCTYTVSAEEYESKIRKYKKEIARKRVSMQK